MTCSCFQTASPLSRGTLDPAKRVNYTLGLVLGEDEFRQEQHYFFERDKLLNRLLHGYGVACGLRVSTAPEGGDFEVRVEPGLALTPRGNVVRVPEAQCARLGAWLQRHRDEVLGRLGSPPGAGPLPLYVRLCFRDCETDPVPIPGGPCRSQEDSLAPSRITDSFELEIALDPPDQAEEDVVRRFGELLGRIDIEEDQPSDITEEEMEDLVRDLLEAGSPPAGPASPPGSNIIHLHPDDAHRILRAAYRVWVAEVRPAIPGGGCAGEPAEDCVLLARLDLDVDDDLAVTDDPQVSVDRRPVLLHTRLLQEMLTGATDIEDVNVHAELQGLTADDHPQYLLANGTRPLSGNLSAGNNRITNLAQANANGQAVRFEQAIKAGDAAGGDLGLTYPNPSVTRLQGRFVLPVQPQPNEVLTFSEGQWMPRPPQGGGGGGVTAHSALTGLTADDHPQYLLTTGARALTGNLSAGNNVITNLAQATANGQAVRFEQAIKAGQTAAGDLGGSYPSPTVNQLRGRAISTQAPNANEVLTFFNSQWTPRPVPVVQPPPPPEVEIIERDLVRIEALSWRHGSANSFFLSLDGQQVMAVALSFTGPVQVSTLDDNTFQLFTEGPGNLRNQFRIAPDEVVGIEEIQIQGGLIVAARRSPGTRVPGAALVFNREILFNEAIVQPPQLTIVLRGDFVLDENGRAVDAEFLRAELPTGSHPSGSSFGLQGGRFESWATVGEGVPIRGGFDLNTVTRDQLMTIESIGPATADRIIARRNEVGRFKSLDDLQGIGITSTALSRLRPQ